MNAVLSERSKTRKQINHYSDLDAGKWKAIIPHHEKYYSRTDAFRKNRYGSVSRSVRPLVIGEESIVVAEPFFSIVDEIEKSKYILELREGWDDSNAKSISSDVWNSSVLFLIRYSEVIRECYSIVISTPEINPCRNGSIDLSWRTSKARMLINVRKENGEIVAFYYGDMYNNKSVKGAVPVTGIENHLAVWMTNLI